MIFKNICQPVSFKSISLLQDHLESQDQKKWEMDSKEKSIVPIDPPQHPAFPLHCPVVSASQSDFVS